MTKGAERWDATQVDTIRVAARGFRRALELMPKNGFVSLEAFPRGACGDAAILLGQLLHDEGFGTWDYMSGERPRGTHDFESHGWIEQNGVIADITADQFPEVEESVLVTSDRRWHGTFDLDDHGHPALIDVYDDHTRRTLRKMYERACQYLAPEWGVDAAITRRRQSQ